MCGIGEPGAKDPTRSLTISLLASNLNEVMLWLLSKTGTVLNFCHSIKQASLFEKNFWSKDQTGLWSRSVQLKTWHIWIDSTLMVGICTQILKPIRDQLCLNPIHLDKKRLWNCSAVSSILLKMILVECKASLTCKIYHYTLLWVMCKLMSLLSQS